MAELDDEILKLCAPICLADLPPEKGTINDYRLLVNELLRLMVHEQPFPFVGQVRIS